METAQPAAPFTNFLESFTTADSPDQAVLPEHTPPATPAKPDAKHREGRPPVDKSVPFAPGSAVYLPNVADLASAPPNVPQQQPGLMAASDAPQASAAQTAPAPKTETARVALPEEITGPIVQTRPLVALPEQTVLPPAGDVREQPFLPPLPRTPAIVWWSGSRAEPPVSHPVPATCVDPPADASRLQTPAPTAHQNSPAPPEQPAFPEDSVAPSLLQSLVSPPGAAEPATLPPATLRTPPQTVSAALSPAMPASPPPMAPATVTQTEPAAPPQTTPATPPQTTPATPPQTTPAALPRDTSVARQDSPPRPKPSVGPTGLPQPDLDPNPPEKQRQRPAVSRRDSPAASGSVPLATSLARTPSVPPPRVPGAQESPSEVCQRDPSVAPPDLPLTIATSVKAPPATDAPTHRNRNKRTPGKDLAALPSQSPGAVYRSNPPIEPRHRIELPGTPAPAETPVPPVTAAAHPVRAARVAFASPAAAVPLLPQSIYPSVPEQQNPVVTTAGAPPAQNTVHAANKTTGLFTSPVPAASHQASTPPPVPRSPAQSDPQPERQGSGANSRPSVAAIVQDASTDCAPPAETAFLAHLVPATEPAPEAAPQARAVPAPHPTGAVRLVTPEVPSAAIPSTDKPPDPAAPPEPEPARSMQKTPPATVEHLKKTDAPAAVPAAPPAESAVRTTTQPLTAPEARSSSRAPESPRNETVPAARVQAAAPLPEPVNAPAGSRNVEMHFTVDEGRVQVHVAERGGEVRVAVHTPDANLAGTLREELPQLTSRLEQSGFHTETWHGPTAGSSEGARAAEPAPGSPRQDSPDAQQRHSGGQQNEEQQRRQPPEEQAGPRPGREDFSWLFDAVRIND